MRFQEIERIMRENEKYAKMLQEYDRTGVFPLDKVRRSFTLKQMTMKKLKSLSEATGKSMSDIIDDLVEKN
jgi:RNA processing factor Prp31